MISTLSSERRLTFKSYKFELDIYNIQLHFYDIKYYKCTSIKKK